MSKLTDALDGLEVELPKTPRSVVVSSDAARTEAARGALAAGGGLDAALRAAFPDGEVELVGFCARTAEPFARTRGPVSEAVVDLTARLATSAPMPGLLEPVWGAHRGHAVFLLPTLAGGRAAIALRAAELLDAARALGSHRDALAAVSTALTELGHLEQALSDDAMEALVAAAQAGTFAPAQPSAPADGLAVCDGLGNALLARRPADGPLALLERAGRPFAASLGVGSVATLLDVLHLLVDLDVPRVDPRLPGPGFRTGDGNTPEPFGAGEGLAAALDAG